MTLNTQIYASTSSAPIGSNERKLTLPIMTASVRRAVVVANAAIKESLMHDMSFEFVMFLVLKSYREVFIRSIRLINSRQSKLNVINTAFEMKMPYISTVYNIMARLATLDFMRHLIHKIFYSISRLRLRAISNHVS